MSAGIDIQLIWIGKWNVLLSIQKDLGQMKKKSSSAKLRKFDFWTMDSEITDVDFRTMESEITDFDFRTMDSEITDFNFRAMESEIRF